MLFCHIVSRTSARTAIVCAGALSLLTGLKACTASAQAPAAMSLVQLAELPRLIDPQLSPNGQSVAYMLGTADWTAGRLVYHLWRQDIGGAPVALTSGAPGDTPGGTRWSPDSTSILFVRGGQLMLMSASGGAARAITKHATNVAAPSWSPDGNTIYFTAPDAPTAEERERERRRDDVYAFEENYKQRQLWSLSVATGDEKQLTSGDLSVASYRLSGDGRQIVLERAPTPLADDAHRGEVWLMAADGSGARQLTRNNVEEQQPELSPDGSQVLFIAETNEAFEPYYNTNLFVMAASGAGTPKPALASFPYAIDQASWSPDGKSILAVANMGIHAEIFQVDVAARRATQLTDGRHFIPPGWQVVPTAGKMAFQLDEPDRFGDTWTLPIPNGAAAPPMPTRVTGVYDALAQKYAVPRQDKVTWKSKDGTTIEGLLIYPVNYTAGTRYPLVVQMHGGPAESDRFGAGPGLLLSYFPVLSGKGWFVFRPNYRGSTGYGNAFLRDVFNGYFRNMQFDILTGVDSLIKQGFVDPDRMVLMGWSAGGHLTNKLVTMTTRFKAASSGAGAADWQSMYAQTDARDHRTPWFGGTPWQRNAPISAYWNASPLKDAANVKTPTLFVVGENDARVPKEQSVEMWRALKSHGVPTHVYIAPREGHLWSELRHQITKANTEMAWFEKYALGKSYVPEIAPAP
jgi:dipeptidyl aminopeptidase/acylaminoacyl peptidase